MRVEPLRLGAVLFHPDDRQLEGPVSVVRLEPRVAQALLTLGRRLGEVTTRDTLFAEIWPRGMVGDDSLNRLIAALRRALQSAGGEAAPQIETIPRTGYRLNAPTPGSIESAGGFAAFGRRRLLGVCVLALGSMAAVAWPFRRTLDTAMAETGEAALAEANAAWEQGTLASRESGRRILGARFRDMPEDRRLAGAFGIASAEALVAFPRDSAERGLIKADFERAVAVASPEDERAARALMAWTGAQWTALEDALWQAPDNRHVRMARVDFLSAVGRLDEARALSRRMLEDKPTSPFRHATVIFLDLTAGDYDAAEERIAAAARYHPYDPVIWRLTFTALALMGRFDEALARFRQSLPGAPETTMPPSARESWRTTLEALTRPDAALVERALTSALEAPRQYYSATPASLLQLALLQRQTPLVALARSYFTLDFALVRRPRMALVYPLRSRAMAILWDHKLLAVRRSPSFAAIARSCGLDTYWQGGGRFPDDRLAAQRIRRPTRKGP